MGKDDTPLLFISHWPKSPMALPNPKTAIKCTPSLCLERGSGKYLVNHVNDFHNMYLTFISNISNLKLCMTVL